MNITVLCHNRFPEAKILSIIITDSSVIAEFKKCMQKEQEDVILGHFISEIHLVIAY